MLQELQDPEAKTVEENLEEDEATPDLDVESKDNIKAALIHALKDPEAADVLAEHVALKTKELNKVDKTSVSDKSIWKSGEDFLSCIPCLKYSDSDKVPLGLRKSRRGNFGRISLRGD